MPEKISKWLLDTTSCNTGQANKLVDILSICILPGIQILTIYWLMTMEKSLKRGEDRYLLTPVIICSLRIYEPLIHMNFFDSLN